MRIILFTGILIGCNTETLDYTPCGHSMNEVPDAWVAPLAGDTLTRSYVAGEVTRARVDFDDVPIGVHAGAFAAREVATTQQGWTDPTWQAFAREDCYGNFVLRHAPADLSIDDRTLEAERSYVEGWLPHFVPQVQPEEPVVVTDYFVVVEVRQQTLVAGAREVFEEIVLASQPPGALLHFDERNGEPLGSMVVFDEIGDARSFDPQPDPGWAPPTWVLGVSFAVEVDGAHTPGLASLQIELIPD